MVALPPVRREARHGHVHPRAALTKVGCFSSSDGLSDQGSYKYQTASWCQPICVGQNQAVLGLSGGSDCWCGDTIPPADSMVDDSNCDVPCNGYDKDNCGGINYWSVYLTGTSTTVSNFDDKNDGDDDASSSSSSSSSSTSSSSDSSTSSTSAPSSSSTSSSTTVAPSVVTSVAPGTTVVVTAPAARVSNPPPEFSTDSASKGSKTNVAGLAAGIVVGFVVVVAGIAALVFWIKHKRRKDAETESKRSTQVNDFMRGGREGKPPRSGYSNMSDERLDPQAGARRNSVGSIADNQDYSRKILRVANPDDR
nr:cell wall integrity and stress response component 2 [Quercus suber]